MPEVAWVPAWRELDQTIQVGTAGEYYFWGDVPEAPRAAQGLVFYNAEWNVAAMVAASGFIVGIRHPVLGALRKVDTIGLDYTFVLGRRSRSMPTKSLERSTSGKAGRLRLSAIGAWWSSSVR